MKNALLSLVTLLALGSCGPDFYRAYLLDVTEYDLDGEEDWDRTPKGAYIRTTPNLAHADFYRQVDEEIEHLSACLIKVKLRKKPIDFSRVAVYVPPDWYNSYCSTEQLLPSRVSYKLCKAKGLEIPKECRGLLKPTPMCPCVCNVRAAIVDMHIVATPPNLKLFKAELSRLILYPKFNNPWQKPLNQCLKVGQP
jgi:hypothetical protein